MDASMLHDHILALENATWKTQMETGAALLPYLSHECIMLFPLGMKITSKTEPSMEEVMKSDAFVPWRRYRMSDVVVTALGPEAAQISYRVQATRQHITDDQDTRQDEFKALVSSTWRKDAEAGKFLMVLHQQTPYEQDLGDL
jgi:hypothetical protein